MNKIRIPLPKQVEKVIENSKRYNRNRDQEVCVEWEINCSNCGIFIQEQAMEPKKCPICHDSKAEISEL